MVWSDGDWAGRIGTRHNADWTGVDQGSDLVENGLEAGESEDVLSDDVAERSLD